jgi:hypothetical protein
MRWLAILMATLSLAACVSYTREPSPAPTVVVPSGATVVCPSGAPAVYASGAYRC